MKFSAVIAIAVAIVALTSLVAVEASPIGCVVVLLSNAVLQILILMFLSLILPTSLKRTRQGHYQVDIIGIQVNNISALQDPLVSIPFKSLFLGTTITNISTRSFNHLLNKYQIYFLSWN
ncbi:hypothetical protein BDF22DRAFT_774394 [Syncephalis plumigaleata]|nr:hypothetical protein BDF22DRAFT_774394 [Syncephalis plumigaleata]